MSDDFQYVKLPDGSYGKFAHDADDASIRSAIQKDFPDAFKQAETPKPSAIEERNESIQRTLQSRPDAQAPPSVKPPKAPGLLNPAIPRIEDARREQQRAIGGAANLAVGGPGIAKIGQEAIGLGPVVKAIAERPAIAPYVKSVGILAKGAGDFVSEIPIVGGLVKGGIKAARTLGQLGDVWREKPIFPGAPLPEHPGTFPGGTLPETPAIELRQGVALNRLPATGARPMAESGEALATKPTARDLVANPIPIQQAVQQARAVNVPPPKPVPTLPAEGGMRITDPSAAATINRDLAIPTRRATDIVRPQAIRVLPKEEFNIGEGPFQFKNGESALNHYGNVLSKSDMEALAEKRGIPKAQIDKLLAEGKTVKGTGEGGHITGEDVKANLKSEVPTTKLWHAITDTYTPEELDALQDRANKLRPALSPEGRTLGKGTKAMQAIVKRAFFPELAQANP